MTEQMQLQKQFHNKTLEIVDDAMPALSEVNDGDVEVEKDKVDGKAVNKPMSQIEAFDIQQKEEQLSRKLKMLKLQAAEKLEPKQLVELEDIIKQYEPNVQVNLYNMFIRFGVMPNSILEIFYGVTGHVLEAAYSVPTIMQGSHEILKNDLFEERKAFKEGFRSDADKFFGAFGGASEELCGMIATLFVDDLKRLDVFKVNFYDEMRKLINGEEMKQYITFAIVNGMNEFGNQELSKLLRSSVVDLVDKIIKAEQEKSAAIRKSEEAKEKLYIAQTFAHKIKWSLIGAGSAIGFMLFGIVVDHLHVLA